MCVFTLLLHACVACLYWRCIVVMYLYFTAVLYIVVYVSIPFRLLYVWIVLLCCIICRTVVLYFCAVCIECLYCRFSLHVRIVCVFYVVVAWLRCMSMLALCCCDVFVYFTVVLYVCVVLLYCMFCVACFVLCVCIVYVEVHVCVGSCRVAFVCCVSHCFL